MVKIRLKRIGAKKKPFYRVVVADSRAPRNGKFIEEIGTYDPMADPSKFSVDMDKVREWVAKGAQMTDTVMQLVKKNGGMEKQATVEPDESEKTNEPEASTETVKEDDSKVEEAAAAIEETDSKVEKPAAAVEEADSKVDKPAAAVEETDSKVEEPAAAVEEADSKVDKPAAAVEETDSKVDKTASTEEETVSGEEEKTEVEGDSK